MTYKKLQNTFERELLLQIISDLRKKAITPTRAKRVAQAFLPVLRSENVEVFIEKLSKLSYNYPEIMEAFIPSVKEYEKEKIEENLIRVRDGLKGGEINGNN